MPSGAHSSGDGREHPRDPRLAFCLRNVDFSTRDRLITKHGARGVGCLGKCSLCFHASFIEIDGETCVGENHEEIVAAHAARAAGSGGVGEDRSPA